MRGVETRIQEIRHRIFREAARMAYHTEWPIDKRIEELPYKIIPGEVGNFRNDVFLERAIVGEPHHVYHPQHRVSGLGKRRVLR